MEALCYVGYLIKLCQPFDCQRGRKILSAAQVMDIWLMDNDLIGHLSQIRFENASK